MSEPELVVPLVPGSETVTQTVNGTTGNVKQKVSRSSMVLLKKKETV